MIAGSFIVRRIMNPNALNVPGQPLLPCPYDPLTGYFRDGCCNTREDDSESHVICARMTAEFLQSCVHLK